MARRAQIPPELAPFMGRLYGVALPRRRGPGVYFLLWRGRIIYIGQSRRPHRRIAGHFNLRCDEFDAALVLPCPASALDGLEGALLRHFKPVDNCRRDGKLRGDRGRSSEDAHWLRLYGFTPQLVNGDCRKESH